MKKLLALLLLLAFAPVVMAANTPPPGSTGNIITNNGNGQYGAYALGTGLNTTTSGGITSLNATTSGAGGSPAGVFPQLQYTTGAAFAALSADTLASYAAHDTVMNGTAYDPRNYGAICGGYNINVSDGHTATYNYTIPFVGSSSTDNTNFFVFTEDTSGFDTANILATTDFSVTGVNSGSGTITLNSGVVPTTGKLIIVVHDDSAGFVSASTAAAASGGYVSVPDNCTIYGSQANGTVLAEGAQLIGQSFTPNYTFQGTGTKPILNVISPSGFPPNFGFNIAGKAQQFFEGFEITSHVPGYNSLGFLKVPVLIGGNGSIAGGGEIPGITAQYMTFNYGIVGFGSPIGGSSSYIFSTVRFSTFAANTAGIYGPLSDQRIIGNDFNSNGAFGSTGSAGGIVIGPQQSAPGASGAAEISGNRFEFNEEGIVTQSAALIHMEDNEFDGNSLCGLDLNGFYSLINVTGGWFRGNGNGGGSFTGSTTSGHDAHVCANSTNSGSNGVTFSNVNFINNYGENSTAPIGSPGATTPLYVLDVSTTGSWNSNISFSGGSAPFGVASANNASVTDSFIFRNGQSPGFKIQNVGGQANQGGIVNGSLSSQARELPSNQWGAYYVFGDASSANDQQPPITNGYASLVSRQIGVGPTYFLQNDFSHYDCDVVNNKIIPNSSPNFQGNPIITWLPTPQDPSYGGGFYQGHETDTNSCRLAALTWMAVPSSYKVYGQSSGCVATGTWAADNSYGGNYGITSSTNGDTLACTTTTHGGPLYLWYQMNGNNGGTFTYQVDSGPVSANVATQGQNQFTFPINSTTFTVGAVRIPQIAPGSHTVNIAVSSTTSASNTVTIEGIGTAPGVSLPTSQPIVFLGGQTFTSVPTGGYVAAVAAFNNDEMLQANQLASDGLGVYFAPVQNYFNFATDNDGSFHINALGQKHIAQAFNGVIQGSWNSMNALNPLDFGAACNTQLFTDTYVDGTTHLVTTTTGSNTISINNYTFQPGMATQTGGGDVGKQISVGGRSCDPGPTTYIASVTTASNTATVAWPAGASCSTNDTYAVMGGYPSNPNDASTAHDDTAAIQAATVAANYQTSLTASNNTANTAGGRVFLPNNCLIHNLVPANNVEIVGNNGGHPYSSGGAPNDMGASTTHLYVASTNFADDNLYGINLTGTRHIRLRDFTISSLSFPYLGYSGETLSCIGLTTPGGDLDDEDILLDHIAIYGCPVGFGVPFGLNQPVSFTASISGTTMTVTSINSTNFSVYQSVASDWLALGRTVSGAGVTSGTEITAAAPNGLAGTYTVSLSQTVTSESMTSPAAGNVIAGASKNVWVGVNGIGFNGDFSDWSSENDVFTGNFNVGWYMGPNGSGSGNAATRILGGRFEENGGGYSINNGGFVCDACFDVQFTGTQFQFNGSGAFVTHGTWGAIQFTGGMLEGNGSTNPAAGDKSQIILGGSGSELSLSGVSIYEPNYSGGGNANYIFETTTGSTVDYVSLEGGDVKGGFNTAITNFQTGVTHYKQNATGISSIDTTQTILSATSTGGVGIGTNIAHNGTSLDLLSETATTNSSIGLPNHTTTNRPTGVTGMFGLNTTTSALEFYDQSNWNILPSTTTIAPGPNYSLVSTTTGGDEGQWSLTGTITSGTAGQVAYYAATGQQVSGSSVLSQTATGEVVAGSLTFTSTTGVPAAGIYLPSANTLALAASTTELAAVTTGGLNILVGGIAFAGNLTVALPNSDTTSVLLGLNALVSQSSTSLDNTGIGSLALNALTTGTKDLAIGYKAGQKITVGGSNVVIGPLVASTTLTIGSNNILIGTTSALDTSTSSTSNALNIGNLYEGDTSINHPYINGSVPTISSGAGDFGTAPSIVGNDVVGKVVIGSSPGGQGTITFANPWTNSPDSCSCNNNTTTARGCSALAITTTSFALGATTSPFTEADQLGYECKSHRL